MARPDPEPFVCGVCGRVLDHESGVGYIHSVRDRASADHEVEPVRQSEALVVAGRCDFCYRDYPEWVVPAAEFEVLPGHLSTGDWAACGGCAALVESNQWSALVRRAQVGWEARNGPMPDQVLSSLPRLYRLLRKNIVGTLKPNPGLSVAPSAKFGRGWKSRQQN